jgi:calcineurin-like phosphoesterase
MAPINSPWEILKAKIEEIKSNVDYIVVDFHAEATAEKIALGRYLSELGVSFFTGTHTHVQTADEKIINGMAYITDAGLCGSPDGVIGMDYESSLKRFLTATPVRYEVAETGTLQINAVEVTLDELQATDIRRINISYVHNKEGMEAKGESGP